MRTIILTVVLFAAALLSAQTDQSTSMNSEQPQKSNGQVTVSGCVSKQGGDYILMKENPGVSYELQATGTIHFKNYLGQRVEVTGTEGSTMSTSEDAMNKGGNASAQTITVNSIKTLDRECRNR